MKVSVFNSKLGEAIKNEIPWWPQPVQGKSTQETDRVAVVKDSLHTFFSQRKYEKRLLITSSSDSFSFRSLFALTSFPTTYDLRLTT